MKTMRFGALLAMGVIAAASAQAADWYVGVGLGSAEWKDDGVSVPAGVSLDKRDTGYKLVLGASLSPNLAVEGGYVDLGKAHISGTSGETTVSADLKGHGLFIDLVGKMPVATDWTLYGKFGIFNGRAKLTSSEGDNESDSGTDIKYGVGISYAITKTVTVQGEWERYRFKGWGEKQDVDLLSVGVNFAF